MKPVDIYITSWLRPGYTVEVIEKIVARTKKGSYKIHILENESNPESQKALMPYLNNKTVESILFHNYNTRCLWGKPVFHAMTDSDSKYYVVTDNDILPPDLTPDWLEQMIDIMERNPDLGLLTPQFPPVQLMGPLEMRGDHIVCTAVVNALKLVRRESFPEGKIRQNKESFSDDGHVSELIKKEGYKVAFCKNIFCGNLGQTENWGYKAEDIHRDPRKSGYSAPFMYETKDNKTYESPDHLRM
jgi:hypothetical protein